MKKIEQLFTPIKLGGVEIKNRIVMPPMGIGFGGSDGSVTEKLMDYYEARAAGGAGMIIVQVTTVNSIRKYASKTLGLFDDKLIPSWKELVKRIHAHGAKISTQLFDPGPFSPSSLSGVQPVGPSPIAARGFQELPRQLSLEEIEEVINDFVEAARRAREAGLDAIEIHAAHGYAMIGSFLNAYFNKRIDRYGGSLEGRVQLLVDILRRIKDKVGSDFPVIVRISGDDRVAGGRSLQETQFIAPMIVEAGADALEISGGTVPETFWAVTPPSGTPLAFNADFAQAVKQVVDVPVISPGRINTPHLAEFIIKSGKADMVAIGRALMADPEFPKKAMAGNYEDIRPCIGDNQGCLGVPLVKRPTTCTMNPAVGREKEMTIVPTDSPKQVVVVGGGPAGLEASRVAALRGHKVTLFERENTLGGQINLACVPPFKQEFINSIKYFSRQAEKAGVDLEIGKEATPEVIENLNPDAVILATGAIPNIPADIPGINGEQVVTAWDVLSGRATLKAGNVVILGGGSVGCETADFLAETGDNLMVGKTSVTVVEMMSRVAMDMAIQTRHLLMQRLAARGVKLLTSTKVLEILNDGVKVVQDGREEKICGMDQIVLALGAKPIEDLSEKLKGKLPEVYVIGDAKKPRSLVDATAEGAEIGRII